MTDRPFLTIQDTAKELGMHAEKVTELIRQGRLPALFADEGMRSVRIPRTALYPEQATANDFRHQRLRRLQATAKQLRETATQKRQAWIDAQDAADRAAEAVDIELRLHEIEAAERAA